MTEAEAERLAHASYWDERYSEVGSDGNVHEWFRSFEDLEPFFETNLFKAFPAESSPKILHLGSGDSVSSSQKLFVSARSIRDYPETPKSPIYLFPKVCSILTHLPNPTPQTIPADLAARGYTSQLCVDFSAVVVQTMSARHSYLPSITWLVGDVRALPPVIAPSTITIAFDKGTLDAMIHGSPWSPPADVRDNTSRYIREVHRVLVQGGRFLYVTYRQPHFVRPLLVDVEGVRWGEVRSCVLGGEGSSFEYFGFVLVK
jgi:EEF1A lysine methyltransferase 4